MPSLSDMAVVVRKNDYVYEQPRKSRTPEGVIVGGAAVGGLGALGVNNAVQLPKRNKDAIKYWEDRAKTSVPAAKKARARAANTTRMRPLARRKFDRAARAATNNAATDLKALRQNKHIARNMKSFRLRQGASSGLLMAGGAGLAALGSKMRRARDEYESA